MLADAAVVPYSIIKDPASVVLPLKKLPSSIREKITDAIDGLQSDPRPPKHSVIPGIASIPTLKLEVAQGWYLMYQVDDRQKKVCILLVGRF